MRKYLVIIIFIVFNNHIIPFDKPKKAIVIVPIADLSGIALSSLYPSQMVNNMYEKIPYETASKSSFEYACPRIHQLIFNEMVEVIEEKNSEVCIKVPHLFYITDSGKTPHTTYWTLKKNIRFLDDLAQKNISSEYFPVPLSFDNPNMLANNNTTATLQLPWQDNQTKIVFSVGTRFVKTKKQVRKNYITVYFFNAFNNQIQIASIPRKLCIENIPSNLDEKIDLLIQIVRSWINQTGFIAYVWGGCSFATRHTKNNYCTKVGQYKNNNYTYYDRPDRSLVINGFDCAGLIARAAQIVGIPYFLKNTYTIATLLKECMPEQLIEQGDILWIPGHVMIISDIKKNTIIEARAYGHGYGIVQEVPLASIFKGIHTYEQFKELYRVKTPIQRLDQTGLIVAHIPQYKIFKIKSVYEINLKKEQ